MVNTLSFTDKKRVRKNFGKLKEVSKFPNLIEIQKNSYDEFLLENESPSSREDRGLQKVFKSVFPLEDFSGSARIEFIDYSFQKPKFDIVCNVTSKPESNPENIKRLLVDQIFSTVRWRESVINMSKGDITNFIELGPGKVLSGLIKRINKEVKINTINIENDIKDLKIWTI